MKKINQIMLETYQLLFENSEPKADFNQLMANATINKYGEKEIPFSDYTIDYALYEKIMEEQSKKYKLNKLNKQLFSNSILLGCSPKFKNYNI